MNNDLKIIWWPTYIITPVAFAFIMVKVYTHTNSIWWTALTVLPALMLAQGASLLVVLGIPIYAEILAERNGRKKPITRDYVRAAIQGAAIILFGVFFDKLMNQVFFWRNW